MKNLQRFLVTNVDDGDSFDGHFIHQNNRRSRKTTIRLIGVDTPESDQAMYKEASAYTRRRIMGKVIEVDVISKDVYGRHLAVAYIKEGDEYVELNADLKAKGYVYVRGQHHRPKWD